MEIVYGGDASFTVRGQRTIGFNGAKTDPRPDVALFSSRKAAVRQVVDGPGEYEIGGVLIGTVPVGPLPAQSLAHVIDLDGVSILFIDDVAHGLRADALETIGRVDVLIVRADDLAAAQRLTADVTPRVTIPYGAKAVELAAAAGIRDADPISKFSWNGISTAPKVVLLKAPTTKRRAA